MQSGAVGSAMQALSTARSTFVIAVPSIYLGIVPAAPYVAKHVVDFGLLMHSFIGVRSVLREDRDFGRVVLAL